MRKHTIVLTILCSILIVCPFTSALPSVNSRVVPDWSDGEFHGVWNKPNDQTSGSFWGDLNQGRRATRGIFTGEWNLSDGTATGTFRGIFYGMILVGQWDVTAR